MSEADKMFKELGYEKDIEEAFGVVRYKHIKEDYYIRFYLRDRTFDANRISKNKIFPLEIDYKLLQAINKKFQELECHMSEADEMFEKLDYKKIEKSNKIIYREKMGLLIPNAEIVFYKNDKWIGVNFNLDMQELKAINKKCEELGWI